MLHDRARIHVQAGAGGDGCMSFRREAHVPRGGPDGGDGGRGGDVVVVCDDSLRDLQSFRRRTHYRAGRGGHGEGALRHGADGETLAIARAAGHGDRRPGRRGGRSRRAAAGSCSRTGSARSVARGGGGGKGNKRFATPTRQAPRFAERGLPGRGGLAGAAGSSCSPTSASSACPTPASPRCSRVSRAPRRRSPTIPFTTLEPVLGVLEGEERQLIVADIPGLIEGASEGAGLGHDFLAHVERTRLLVHVLDLAPSCRWARDADALANHATIERELARARRAPRARCRACSRCRRPTSCAEERAREAVARVAAAARARGARDRHLERHRPGAGGARERAAAAVSGWRRRRAEVSSRRGRAGRARGGRPRQWRAGARRAHGVPPGRRRGLSRRAPRAERRSPSAAGASSGCSQRYDLDNDDALAYLEGRLRRIGVLGALEAEGFQPGDEIEIARRRPSSSTRARRGRRGDASTLPHADETRGHQARLERRRRRRRRRCAWTCSRGLRPARRRCTARATEAIVVTSGAIARGMRVMSLPAAPELDRRAAGGQRGRPGQALPRLRRAAARARRDRARRCC